MHDCPVVGLLSTHGETDDCFEALDVEMAGEKDILGIDVVLGSVVIIFSSGLAIISHGLSFFPPFLIKRKNRRIDEVMGKKKDKMFLKKKKKKKILPDIAANNLGEKSHH